MKEYKNKRKCACGRSYDTDDTKHVCTYDVPNPIEPIKDWKERFDQDFSHSETCGALSCDVETGEKIPDYKCLCQFKGIKQFISNLLLSQRAEWIERVKKGLADYIRFDDTAEPVVDMKDVRDVLSILEKE